MFLSATDYHALAAFLPTYESMMHCYLTMADCIRMGISTPDEFIEHDERCYGYYDDYKAVHGVKARWINYSDLTLDEIRAMNTQLDAEYDEQQALELSYELDAVLAFEARITNAIAMGANDRATALRWMLEGADSQGQFYINDIICEQLYHGEHYTALVAELKEAANELENNQLWA